MRRVNSADGLSTSRALEPNERTITQVSYLSFIDPYALLLYKIDQRKARECSSRRLTVAHASLRCRRFGDQNFVQSKPESIEVLFVVLVDLRHQLLRIVLPDLHSCIALVHLVGAYTELLLSVLSPSRRNVFVVELQRLREFLKLCADVGEVSHEVKSVVARSASGGLELEMLLQNVWTGKRGDEKLDESIEGRHPVRLHIRLQAFHSVVLFQHLDFVEVGREQARDRMADQDGLQNERTVVDRLDSSRIRCDTICVRVRCLDDVGVFLFDA